MFLCHCVTVKLGFKAENAKLNHVSPNGPNGLAGQNVTPIANKLEEDIVKTNL